MNNKILIIIQTIILSSTLLFSQQEKLVVIDGLFAPSTRTRIAKQKNREADITFSKRVHREIYLKQKKNHSLYYPHKPNSIYKSMFSIIREGLLKQKS